MPQNDREPTRPSIGLRVQHVTTSRTFYTGLLGFGIADTSLPDSLAQVVDFDNDPLLLIGPDADDVTAYLSEPRIILETGTTLGFFCQNLDAKVAEWRMRGLTDVQEARTPLDDRAMLTKDPDGNVLRFSVPRQRSPEEIIALYEQGPQRLQIALVGLSEQGLELAKVPGEWTIRQLVHHIVDGDDLWMSAVKAALVNSGTQYRHDWYTPDNASAATLDYAGRSIEPALLLFRANHEHILQLVRHLPGALERFVLFAWPNQEPRPLTVQSILYSQAVHIAVHCNEIAEIRSLHQQ